MLYFQFSIMTAVFLTASLSLVFLLKKFKRIDLMFYLILPVIIFLIGFLLRLSKNKETIDLGFYFTEFSYIFLTVLFVLALLLGQIKYWKK